jgi:hypothetical protein
MEAHCRIDESNALLVIFTDTLARWDVSKRPCLLPDKS